MRKLLAFVLICGLFALGCNGTTSSSSSKKGPTGETRSTIRETTPPKGETQPTKTEHKLEPKDTRAEKKTEKKGD